MGIVGVGAAAGACLGASGTGPVASSWLRFWVDAEEDGDVAAVAVLLGDRAKTVRYEVV